ncbi:hypothetical protein [Novacetimonas hansenii]|uniref:Uncharacterized protein n=2 Tax=Novacetimonas hansenii TaxID=436 RepID=A0ABQ0SBE0_NOVHA|nr:hypothetical protein [Novacetimonas hansenii]EFG83538.1 hypothetical protein GXY_12163 [Novacetimonas hansenii ATCC 23769]GAN83918.1 hypothetical protein Gaha_0114_012 [Novacetimonas hansenii JCM 7643]GBQ61980.1 hypothetical protein AA0243_2771 [Novacetimonas hansenii NRIC 0243]GEC62531.1 hypothetical protein GHA01_03800 [Novacetimonas hansenii]
MTDTKNTPHDAGPAGAGQDGGIPAELSHCGAVVDKAIEYMLGENLPPLAVSSALLGGALGLLSRTMGKDAMQAMLENALHSVQAGELHPEHDRVGKN